jgi:hypothetical protein
MRVIDKDTGQEFQLSSTPEFSADLERYYAAECKHTEKFLCRAPFRSGELHFRMQCKACGSLVGNALAKSKCPPDAPFHDKVLERRYTEARHREKEDIYQEHVRLQRTQNEKWWVRYKEYLKSPEWQAKRSKVMGEGTRSV